MANLSALLSGQGIGPTQEFSSNTIFSTGATAGTLHQGGTGGSLAVNEAGGGGGGGGRYGGGGGTGWTTGAATGGGGGGSSWDSNSLWSFTAGAGRIPGNSSETNRGTIGDGANGSSTGKAGGVLIYVDGTLVQTDNTAGAWTYTV
jgi:hypothetical protein